MVPFAHQKPKSPIKMTGMVGPKKKALAPDIIGRIISRETGLISHNAFMYKKWPLQIPTVPLNIKDG